MAEKGLEIQDSSEKTSALKREAESYYRGRLEKPYFFNLTRQAISQDVNTQAELVQKTAEMVRENSIQAKLLQQVVDKLHPGLLPVAKAYASVAILSDRDDDFEAYETTSESFEKVAEERLKLRGF